MNGDGCKLTNGVKYPLENKGLNAGVKLEGELSGRAVGVGGRGCAGHDMSSRVGRKERIT